MTTSTPAYVTFSPNLAGANECANYWIRQVTLRLRREICWRWQEHAGGSERGGRLPPFVDRASESLDLTRYQDEKRKFFESDPTARYLSDQLAEAPPREDSETGRGSFTWVARELHLDNLSRFALALSVSARFDNASGSVMAACLNDPARTYPTLGLAQRLWADPEEVLALADPAHRLFQYGLIRPPEGWDGPLDMPALVARQLLFPELSLPDSLEPISDAGTPLPDVVQLLAYRLASFPKQQSIVPVREQTGANCADLLGGIARITGRNIVQWRCRTPRTEVNPTLPGDGSVNTVATLCWLRGVDLLLRTLPLPHESIPITVFLAPQDDNLSGALPRGRLLPRLDVPALSFGGRVARWQENLGESDRGLETGIAECARRFRYEGAVIDQICAGLKSLPRALREDDLMLACRAELKVEVGDLAQYVVPRFERNELFLPAAQRAHFDEVLQAMQSLTVVHYEWGTARVWNESGISVLFAGPPGTGKTMAAEVLARELDLPMYRIDLSQVVNKYIGETEKNLKRVFDAADISDTLLFFDEADALFGRRTETKDAHDRYANLEISYLLDRMERFKGLAILATNRKKDLDEAFLRRLRYVIDFPMPGYEQRKMIWLESVPARVGHDRLDIEFLARRFPLAGGHIRSIVFNACLQSAGRPRALGERPELSMETVLVGVKREFDKLSRSISLEQFGPYAKLIEALDESGGKP